MYERHCCFDVLMTPPLQVELLVWLVLSLGSSVMLLPLSAWTKGRGSIAGWNSDRDTWGEHLTWVVLTPPALLWLYVACVCVCARVCVRACVCEVPL